MRKIFAAFAQNTVFANIVLAMIFFAGGLATINLIREAFPRFSLDMIMVSVPWPGADPEEVEEGICRKIEEAIEGLDGIRQYDTTSAENIGTALIEVQEGYDVDYVKDRVRNKVDAISTFPEDAEKPVTEEMLIRDEVAMVALSGEGLTERELKEWGEEIKEEMRMLPGLSQVEIFGARDYEIAIEVSEERLREYGLNFSQVAAVVRSNSMNLSGGTMRTRGEEIRLRTLGRRYTAREFATIEVLAPKTGEIITLDRIADIRDEFTEDKILSRFNTEPTLNISVLKTQEEDTLAIDKTVRAYVIQKQKTLPTGMHIVQWAGTADILQARISLLVRNGIIGLVLVFILLWLFLDIRLSFWAGMGMPISVMGALAIMWGIGTTLNMISLFALIMVLGIIVDDAIVVGEAIYVHRKSGASPLRAAVDGVTEVGMPVIAAVTTTIVAFVPLMFVGGIMGKFIFILPVVVIACLVISLIECLILLPAHLSHLPEPGAPVKNRFFLIRFGRRLHYLTNHGMEWVVIHLYEPFLKRALRQRYVCFAVAIFVLLTMVGVNQSGLLKFQVFPKIDGNILTASVEFPNGTPLSVTEKAVKKTEEAFQRIAARSKTLSGAPLLRNIYSLTGETLDEYKPTIGSNVGAVRVEMLDAAERGVYSEDLLIEWEKELGAVPGAISLTFEGMSAGPPGAPLEIWIQGQIMEDILAAAEALKNKLATYDGVYQIRHDFRPGKNEIKLRLKPEARSLGLSVSDLARQINAGYFGEEAIRLQRGRDDVRVRVRYPEEERKQLTDFERIRVRTPFGDEVPLLSVADVSFGPGYSTIQRTNGARRVTVSAEVNFAKANAQEIFIDLEKNFFPDLQKQYRSIYLSVQGEKKKRDEAFGSLFVGYPLALVGIFIIIATIFRSYIQPLVIMITVPFGLIGAMIGHLLMGYDLSMMSFFGMVALSGVVVNDAIVLIECINTHISKGEPFYKAVAMGGVRRFRAIFLTTVSTVGGLTPLILEKDMQARFLIPMAISIAAGVAFATLLTLLLIPCLLCILNDFRRIVFWLRTRRFPTPEEVEPARMRSVNLLEEQETEEIFRDVAPSLPENQGGI